MVQLQDAIIRKIFVRRILVKMEENVKKNGVHFCANVKKDTEEKIVPNVNIRVLLKKNFFDVKFNKKKNYFNIMYVAIQSSWRFRGDGILSYNPLLRPIQLPWINSLSVKTLQKDAFLMSIQVGQNSSATMAVGIIFFFQNVF